MKIKTDNWRVLSPERAYFLVMIRYFCFDLLTETKVTLGKFLFDFNGEYLGDVFHVGIL